ncbi:MAG: SH3 domain-containing protein [Anaerolineales bacterium]|nr:SH3 domain-containing protein [Anaerolineales bacterium]
MKKMILICLAMLGSSLACLQTAVISETPSAIAAPVFASQTESPAGAVYEIGDGLTLTPTLSLQGEGDSAQRSCAEVIADKSLHLRGAPGEHATVLTWLLHGDVVQVIDQANSDWWLVEFNGRAGYARADYLRERMC